jgi:hypothetical protein
VAINAHAHAHEVELGLCLASVSGPEKRLLFKSERSAADTWSAMTRTLVSSVGNLEKRSCVRRRMFCNRASLRPSTTITSLSSKFTCTRPHTSVGKGASSRSVSLARNTYRHRSQLLEVHASVLGWRVIPSVVHHLLLLKLLTQRIGFVCVPSPRRVSVGSRAHMLTHDGGCVLGRSDGNKPRTIVDFDLSFFWLFHLGSVPPPTLPLALSHRPLRTSARGHRRQAPGSERPTQTEGRRARRYPTGRA